ININKKLIFLILSAVVVTFNACIKDANSGTIVNGLKPMALIPEGGMTNFSKASLSFPSADLSDTVTFHANYAWTNVAPTDITFTLGYDANALSAYNSLGGIQYEKFPDSIYSYKGTSVVVKAGQSYSDAIPLVVYPTKIDPTRNYMLPISIMSAPGTTISGNLSTIYYHFIGNPIAGAYMEEWIRWQNASGSGSPAYDFAGMANVFSATSPTEISVTSQANGLTFIIDFTNNGGVLSNFTATIDPASYPNAGIASILSGPTVTADLVNKKFTIDFSYNLASGAGRTVREIFTK
ncbi:MAG: DUF1735 domain-containing protein, partial [Bacteroidota bacterium]|nr:DUF1735 domain-containing protein [Bacteroidota bacterium]